MKDFKSFDEAAVYVLNSISEIFKNHAILKGGMVFKLLGSPRFTNDIDYVFIPYKSKNDIKENLTEEIKKLFPGKVSRTINSKCIRYKVDLGEIKMQIEVNVDVECKSMDLSTVSLAKHTNQTARIIRAMEYETMLSHKLAAWNERGLYRDLYDAYFLSSILDIYPDVDVLKIRLKNIHSRNNKNKSMSLDAFITKLENFSKKIYQEELENELSDILSKEDLAGMDKKLKIVIKDIASFLKEYC